MRRSQLINLCLGLTVLSVLGAVSIRLVRFPDAPLKDMFVIISPIFFAIAAKRGSHLGRAAVVVGLVGLAFAGLALYAALSSAPAASPT